MTDSARIARIFVFIIFAIFLFFYLPLSTGGSSNLPQKYAGKTNVTIETQFTKYSNLTMKPVLILLANWRSGSSFVGRLLTANDPFIFYSFEPFIIIGNNMIQKKNKPLAQFAIKHLKELMNCQFKSSFFRNYFISRTNSNRRNKFMDLLPVENRGNVNLIQEYCLKKAKKIVIKVVRLTLDIADSVLNINNNIKILYMVRDPRATLSSRRRYSFCRKSKDCSDVQNFCSYLKTDSKVISHLLQKYPERFKAMRYEDLSLDPENYYKRLLKFLGEDYTENARVLYKRLNNGNYTIKHTFHWKEQMSFNDAYQVQIRCTKILNYFGYRLYESKNDYTDLDPLLPKSDIFI